MFSLIHDRFAVRVSPSTSVLPLLRIQLAVSSLSCCFISPHPRIPDYSQPSSLGRHPTYTYPNLRLSRTTVHSSQTCDVYQYLPFFFLFSKIYRNLGYEVVDHAHGGFKATAAFRRRHDLVFDGSERCGTEEEFCGKS